MRGATALPSQSISSLPIDYTGTRPTQWYTLALLAEVSDSAKYIDIVFKSLQLLSTWMRLSHWALFHHDSAAENDWIET